VYVEVEVKPGQGFARVRIKSVTPEVFAARLDWRTMEECSEPKLQQLAYLPGVSCILPDRDMFKRAQLVLEAALHALERNSSDEIERLLPRAIARLGQFPLAHNVEQMRGRAVPKDFMQHYGIIGSDSNLSKLPEPDLVRALRDAIGKKFGELVQRRNVSGA